MPGESEQSEACLLWALRIFSASDALIQGLRTIVPLLILTLSPTR